MTRNIHASQTRALLSAKMPRAKKPAAPPKNKMWTRFQAKCLAPTFRRLKKIGVHASCTKLIDCPCCVIERYRNQGYENFIFFTKDEKEACKIRYIFWPTYFEFSCVFEDRETFHEAVQILCVTFEQVTACVMQDDEDGGYNGTLLVKTKPHPLLYWKALRMYVRVRSIVLYWSSLTSHLYAPGGVGYNRVCHLFEADFTC